ncbi:MAG: hypothetical protein Tsb0020_51750 [Haliangiales bacterium]
MLAAALALTAASERAHAQPDTSADTPEQRDQRARAREAHRQGRTAFDLGDFDKAVEYFKEAYELAPHEAYLYNIAQAYRQGGDCSNALFFYKRYVAVGGESARNYQLVQGRIKELTESCKVIDDMKSQPPLESMEPGAKDPDAAAAATGDAPAVEEDQAPPPPSRPSTLAASIELGPALLDLGELDVDGPHFAFATSVGYPIALGKLIATVGGLFTYTPVPWRNVNSGETGTTHLIGLLGGAGLHYPVTRSLWLRLSLGVGTLVLSGLDPGNVFLAPNQQADGAPALFHARVSAGVEYALSDHLVLIASPAVYSYSPRRDGFREQLNRVSRFEFLAGFGYRL